MSEQTSFLDPEEKAFREQSEKELAEHEAKNKSVEVISSKIEKEETMVCIDQSKKSQHAELSKVAESVSIDPFSDAKNFEHIQRVGLMLSSCTMVPKEYQGKDKVGNCVIALDMAKRMGIGVFTVMQNLYVVYGNPSWKSSYVISAINTNSKFNGQLRFEYTGKEGTLERGCRAKITNKLGETLEGPLVTIKMATDEGWVGKQGSKWRTMPELMMSYRAATFFARLYCPEVLNGMQTVEETYDIVGEVVTDPIVTAESLA